MKTQQFSRWVSSLLITVLALRLCGAAWGQSGSVISWGYDCCGQTNVPSNITNAVAVSAGGGNHSLALLEDGKVIAWGDNSRGQCDVPTNMARVVSVAAGGHHSLALQENGTVTAWGSYYINGGGFMPVFFPPDLTNVVAIAAGFAHDLALKSDGTVAAWGSSGYVSQPPAGLSNVIAVAAGAARNLALLRDGTVISWSVPWYTEPDPQNMSNIIAISANYYNFAALNADHSLIVWGNNDYRQNAGTAEQTNNVAAVACGRDCVLVLHDDGQMSAWGYNYFNQTNIPPLSSPSLAISSGGGHCLAIIRDSAPTIFVQPTNQIAYTGTSASLDVRASGTRPLHFQWQFNGTNISGATNSFITFPSLQHTNTGLYRVVITNILGVATSQDAALTAVDQRPVILFHPTNCLGFIGTTNSFQVFAEGSQPFSYQWRFEGIDISGATNPVLRLSNTQMSQEGRYSVLVSNSFGYTISSSATLSMVPLIAWRSEGVSQWELPSEATNVVALSDGWGDSLILRADGTMVTWGGMGYTLPAANDIAAISAGYYHCLALRSNGTVLMWGWDTSVVPSSATNVVDISASYYHSLALRADGNIVGWGMDGYGQTTIPPEATNVVAISAGPDHSMALRADGTVIAWGYNETRHVSMSNIVAIAGGEFHKLALREDGTVLYVPDGGVPVEKVTNAIAISAGRYHDLALRADGVVIGWGNLGPAPTNATNVVAIASGNYHSLALVGQGPPRVMSPHRLYTVNAGTRVNITGVAVGKTPLRYQWQFNGTNIVNGTNVWLTIPNAQSGMAGEYVLVVTNPLGGVTNDTATLNVLPSAPQFVEQPQLQSTQLGSTVIFSGSATGTEPITYQWQFAGTNIPGANGSSLTLSNIGVGQAGIYTLIASNALGVTQSSNADLAVMTFTAVPAGLPTNYVGSVAWGDYNNDGLLDLLLATQLYRNNGNGTFSSINAGLATGTIGLWGDFDNDGYLDILLVNSSSGTIYRNKGDGTFTNLNLSFSSAANPCAVCGDFDNDGRLDVLICGNLYRNNGNATFSKISTDVPVVQNGSVACGDYDNDGRLDLLIAGTANFTPIFRIYHNNGGSTNRFTDINAGLPGISDAAVSWVDYDADGKLDVFISGYSNSVYVSELLRNNGGGTFTPIATGLPGLRFSFIRWGDCDNDGALNLFLSGRASDGIYRTGLYNLDRNGTFMPVNLGLTNLIRTDGGAWADYNGDGRLDLFLSGYDASSKSLSILYTNMVPVTNNPPVAPTPLNVSVSGDSLTFLWSAGADWETPTAALTYNLCVGSSAGAVNLISPMASTNGFRRLPQPGNVGEALQWTLTNVNFGTYYWSLQTIDSAFAGSQFSPVQTFTFAAKTLPATNITSSEAKLAGVLSANGLVTTAYFEWGQWTNLTFKTPAQPISPSATNFTAFANIAGLLPGNTYSYRLIVTNALGLQNGGTQPFRTADLPQIIPQPVTNRTATNAVLTALVNPNGAGTITYFEYGLTRSYGSTRYLYNLGGGNSFLALTQAITGLIGGQVYHYRVVATNVAGQAYSADLTFLTTPEPEVITRQASNIGPVSATFNGSVRPNTLFTMAYFEYGLTTNYGSSTPVVELDNGTNLVPVSFDVTNLARATTYHFRVAGQNDYATAFGADVSFTTTNDVIVAAATNIGTAKATLNGLVNPNGIPTSVIFEYGLSTNFGRSTPIISLGATNNLLPVTVDVTGLTAGSNYYFRAIATNSAGTRFSAILNFQTLGLFSVQNPNLAGSIGGAMVWGDFDNDGRLDMFVTDTASTRFYRNLGGGSFGSITSNIPGFGSASMAAGDFNNDGWLDLVISGTNSLGVSTRVYRNNGDGTFTDINAGLPAVVFRVIKWGDFDNDGRSDLLLIGDTLSVIYRNNGDSSWTEMAAGLPVYLDASASCADYDNDNRLDILVSGRIGIMYANVFTKLFQNIGNGQFRESPASYEGVRLGFSDWADYDDDGHLDLILGGRGTSLNDILRLYHNNGDGTFSNASATLPQFAPDAAMWGDFDSDGHPDLLMRGQKYLSSQVPPNSYSAVLRNNGDGTFTSTYFPLPEIWSSCGGWADYDNDGRLDVAISGNSRSGAILRVYPNNNDVFDNPPGAPLHLSATVSSNSVNLSWDKVFTQSFTNGLTYNLRIGTAPGTCDVISPLADSSGLRRVVAIGNAGSANRYVVTQLETGTYYWSVQAIDSAFFGSPFADENQFTVLEPLRFSSVRLLDGARAVTLSFNGVTNQVHHIVASTDLINWGELGMAVNIATNHFQFTDTNVVGYPTRFYRIRTP